MKKHIELTNALKKHIGENRARLATVKERSNFLAGFPRADAAIWEREGKTGTTYYLAHRKGSPRFDAGECKRRERIGKGESGKQECQDQIERNDEFNRLSGKKAELSRAYERLIYHLRSAINVLGQAQPDGEEFRRHYYY